jgi:DNA-binding transcriptional LysR family regulator
MKAKPVHRYKELQLGQLRAFCECVRQKTFSKAAKTLHMSPPAVWQQVRALERDFGVRLLQSRDRHLEPSEDGRVFLDLASSIVGSVASLKEHFDQRRANIPRTVTVISSPNIIIEELAQVVAEFHQDHPLIKLALLNYTDPSSLDALIAGRADMAVLPLVLDIGGNRRLLASEPLVKRPWVLLLPAGHPLARKRRLVPADLIRYPLILPATGTVWRERVDEVFRAAGLLAPMHVSLEVSIPLAARRYVSLGLGIALVPRPRGGLDLPNLCSRPLGKWLAPEEIGVFWRRGTNPRPHARLFADYACRLLAAKD